MKRFGNLFDKTFTLEALHDAYVEARRGKRDRKQVNEFERDLGDNLQRLHDELTNGSYRPQPYFHFIVKEPKERRISAPAFRDVVVQHAIYATIRPIFDATFIHENHGCRQGKGIHSASDSLQNFLRRHDSELYTLQLDIRKFYYSINHNTLKQLFRKKIKDTKLLALMELFISDNGAEIGLPIGNLLSQLYALIYLNELDQFIKRELKIEHYVRYVDDFILVGLTKEEAYVNKQAIEEFIASHLQLKLSHWTIAKVKRGCNFVGYRTWKSRKFIRKRSLYNFNRQLKRRNYEAVVSILGHAKDTSSISSMLRSYHASLQISTSPHRRDC